MTSSEPSSTGATNPVAPIHIPPGSGSPSAVTAAAGAVTGATGVVSTVPLHSLSGTLDRGLISHGAYQTLANQTPKLSPAGIQRQMQRTLDSAATDPLKRKNLRAAGREFLKNNALGSRALNPKNKAAAKLAGSTVSKIAPKLLGPGLRVATLGARALPVIGPAITALMWGLDSSERKFVNNFIANAFGRNSGAPAFDAEPHCQPYFTDNRTYFLPTCNDGNRDETIAAMDAGMTQTMKAAFGYDTHDTWHPTNPNPETTPDMSNVISRANAAVRSTTKWAEDLQSTVGQLKGRGPVVDAAIEKLAPQMEAVGELGERVLPQAGSGISETAGSANDFYQQFRAINAQNRREINNSTSGLIPFTANHVNEGKMSNSLAEQKAALDAMQQTASKIRTAADDWSIPAYVPPVANDPSSPKWDPRTVSETSPEQPQLGDQPIDPKSGLPNIPNVPETPAMPSMPQMPSMPGGGMPGGGMPGGGMPGGGMPGGGLPGPGTGAQPTDLADAMDKKAKEKEPEDLYDPDKDKEKKDEDKEKEGEEGKEQTPGVVHAVGTPGEGGNPDDKPPVTEGEPGQGNTAEIGGKTRTFDNPKSAQMAHLLSMPGEGGGKTVEQAASEAGFPVPPTDQDIGEQIDPSQVKPGDVIKSQPDSGVYIGDDEVVTEAGEVKPLSEVTAGANGPHQGIFRLADDGSPPVHMAGADTGPSVDSSMPPQYTGGEPMSGDPTAGPNFTAGGDPGIVGGTNVSPRGVNPDDIPTGP